MKKFSVKRSRTGLGLYSNVKIKKGGFIIEYTGKMLVGEEADKKGGKYLFEVDSKHTIDGTGRDNLARYVNHSCHPNCEAVINGKKVEIYSTKNIEPGEELTYDYGKEYFDEYIKPFGCKCAYCLSKKKP